MAKIASLFFFLLILGAPTLVLASNERLTIAVTASFKPVIDQLAEQFAAEYNVNLNVSSASTGVLYQQVLSGAPFDLFLAADQARPRLLQQQLNLAQSQVQPYAVGQLVLVTTGHEATQLSDLAGRQHRIIIANPKLAPYGEAAEQVLDHVGFQGDRVLANNVVQARQYLSLSLAPVGIISASMAQGFAQVTAIAPELHSELTQYLVVLKPSQKVNDFLNFLSSTEAQRIMVNNGYWPPN